MGSYIYLFRHGITEGNLKKYFYGSTDLPLAAEGRQQILDLAARSFYPHPWKADFYATPLRRTVETLRLIYGRQPYRIIDDLREIDCGSFEMRTAEDLHEEPEFQRWMHARGGDVCPPGGEGTAAFRQRVRRGYRELVSRHRLRDLSVRHNKKDAVSIVICHGGVIGAILDQLFPVERESMWDWIPDPGHGCRLQLERGRAQAYEEL
ncbi:MAG: histidine phosphatase family protein [Anaerovoracaceae bacterium]|jgi:alpha-ribazole phosphatase